MARTRKSKIEDKLVRILNNLTLRKKLLLLYIFCVFFPLIFTDAFIARMIFENEQLNYEEKMQIVASNVATDFYNSIRSATDLSNSIVVNRSVYSFLDTNYESNFSFYDASHEWLSQSGYSSYVSPNISRIVFCVDNDTIVNGGNICTIDSVSDTVWYHAYNSNNKDTDIIFYYMGDEGASPSLSITKKVVLVRKMDYYKDSSCDKLLVIYLDYAGIVSELSEKQYGMTAYVCDGEKILFSTDGQAELYMPFSVMTSDLQKKVGYTDTVTVCGKEFSIHVLSQKDSLLYETMISNFPLIFLLLLLNLVMPLLLVRLINASFINRLSNLSEVFENSGKNVGLDVVEDIEGTDEIARLTEQYNGLVIRNRELIKSVYESKLQYQESEIEKQRAELLAMQMQINPHFLFNCLESIRMHSLINGQRETSDMIERLAALIRQTVDWDDVVPLSKELEFIRNYLILQKNRFGDKFSFRITADETAKQAMIPKLTLATFVENACVHGVEKKITESVIMVEASVENGRLHLEVEDSGAGMNSVLAKRMQDRMNECSFGALENSRKVGILNACMRTKMIAGDDVKFTFESEENVGTYVKFDLPFVTDAEKLNTESDSVSEIKKVNNNEKGDSNNEKNQSPAR